MNSAKKYNLIILAGGDKGPLYDAYGCAIKALLPIHGKPMLDWVVDAFKKSDRIDNAVVVGPEEIENSVGYSFFRKRIFEGVHLLQNLMHAIAYVKFRIYEQKSDPEPIGKALSNASEPKRPKRFVASARLRR